MITLFEEVTGDLTAKELDTIVPIVVKILKQSGEENPITSNSIINSLQTIMVKTNPARIRAVIHYIRANKLLNNLIASQKGYFITNDKEIIQKYLKSLRERVNSINEIIRSIQQ